LPYALPAEDAAIHHIYKEWKRNYDSGNAAGVAALYAGNAPYLAQHFVTGIVQGRATIQA